MATSPSASAPAPAGTVGSPIDWRNLIWVAGALGIMIVAILHGSDWFLNYVHVMAGVLWTGIDLFMGFGVGYPEFWWIAAALAITTALTVQGIGILLPTNLRVYLEMRRPEPDGARIGALMRRYVRNVALQGAMQIAIIVVMARFVTGL